MSRSVSKRFWMRFFYAQRKDVMTLLSNPKWEAFCLHYAQTGNASEAYKKAGYTTKNARSIYSNCNRLLKNDDIKKRLAELTKEMASEKIATAKEIQERLTAILRSEQTEEQVVVEGCGDGISEAKIVKRQAQLKDIIKAGELLARMQGAFDNKANINVVIPVFGGEEAVED